MHAKSNLIAVAILISIIGCKRTNDSHYIDKERLIGKWINTIEPQDTLFIGDSIIHRTHLPSGESILYYGYSLEENEMKLKYKGVFTIYVPESTFQIELDDNLLTIVSLSSYYPYNNGDTFRKLINQ